MTTQSLIKNSAKATLIIGGIWLSTLPISTAGALAQGKGNACMATFERNKAAIEAVAGTPNSQGKIRAIMSKSGCPGAAVSVGKPPVGTLPNARIRWRCEGSAPPLRIRCSVGGA